jgi:isochorismate synthase
MTTEPPFVLCGPAGVLIADGVRACYPEVASAQSALRSGSASIVLGALPFDVNGPAALMTPCSVRHADELPDWPTWPLPAVHVAGSIPAPDVHRDRVRRACDVLTDAGSTLQKVVLARALRLAADAPLDARMILHRLAADDPAAYGYLVDLSAAGEPYTGTALVGASPELLVARDGDRVTCQPFAGSAPRAAAP